MDGAGDWETNLEVGVYSSLLESEGPEVYSYSIVS